MLVAFLADPQLKNNGFLHAASWKRSEIWHGYSHVRISVAMARLCTWPMPLTIEMLMSQNTLWVMWSIVTKKVGMAVRRNSGANSSWKKIGRKKIVQINFFEKKFSKIICWKKKLEKNCRNHFFEKKKFHKKIVKKNFCWKNFVGKKIFEKNLVTKFCRKKFLFNGLVFAPLMDQNLTLKLNFTFKGRVNQHQNQ